MNIPRAVALCLLLCSACAQTPTRDGETRRPNIVIVLADDMGYSHLGSCASEIPTPTLARLAAGSRRSTQFSNAPRCCPSRASLLTGLYPHQAGVGHMTGDQKLPGYRGSPNDTRVPIAHAL